MTMQHLIRIVPAVFLSAITLLLLSGCCSSKEQAETGKDLPPAKPVPVGAAMVKATLDGTTETDAGTAGAFTVIEVLEAGAATPPVNPGDMLTIIIPASAVEETELSNGEEYTMQLRASKPAMGESRGAWTFVKFQ